MWYPRCSIKVVQVGDEVVKYTDRTTKQEASFDKVSISGLIDNKFLAVFSAPRDEQVKRAMRGVQVGQTLTVSLSSYQPDDGIARGTVFELESSK